tara:strand:- start:776 stop:1123 length:348 start_codon:yes stop_codon:yes gene_type:complete
MRDVEHICNINDKWCQEGANPNRHDSSLPVDHPTQHDSHKGGCICPLGEENYLARETVHCEDCDSPNLIMMNTNCVWDVEEQRWVYSDNYDPVYQCAECGADNVDYNVKKIVNAV